MRRQLLVIAALVLAALPGLAAARSTSALCSDAIAQTERRSTWLPLGLLESIALVESGYRASNSGQVTPWPWTINSPAGSFYLSSRREAIAKVEELQRRGISNIDVGCMQINLHFHPQAFHSLDDAFNPASNVAYAGRFLRTLLGGDRSLFQAVGRYHSATPARRDAYARKVFRRWGKDFDTEVASRHGVGTADSPLLLQRDATQLAASEPSRVWRGIYGGSAPTTSVLERSGTGGWARGTSTAAPTRPRGAGQITFR